MGARPGAWDLTFYDKGEGCNIVLLLFDSHPPIVILDGAGKKLDLTHLYEERTLTTTTPTVTLRWGAARSLGSHIYMRRDCVILLLLLFDSTPPIVTLRWGQGQEAWDLTFYEERLCNIVGALLFDSHPPIVTLRWGQARGLGSHIYMRRGLCNIVCLLFDSHPPIYLCIVLLLDGIVRPGRGLGSHTFMRRGLCNIVLLLFDSHPPNVTSDGARSLGSLQEGLYCI
ncbi:unnamed protein product [Mytilus edulis]|uniref:Uncharacterized protein n=1 Tax=Mytilus edulis TaxID=6550 RepID=A0A8S3Q640_MYTED|nr:unnamed protein product [Mytilus edulis]